MSKRGGLRGRGGGGGREKRAKGVGGRDKRAGNVER